ncbi:MULTISPECIES: hypothetical protein [Sphingomonas]|uniref:Tip attachment protein J domain-containing protein n=1 Tax=Sphingomonas molluscorum TaxID=418184 RepID=A0ABU8Q7M3_9SPHN|nr:hypothetical protein [Sphingomonas sp. JUb134]MBM7407049.1 hypothetical protein [Sphingomonas sp. JUb134]
MAKALKIAAIGLGALALAATGVGAVALGGLAGTLTIAGVSTSTLLLTASGLSMASSLLQKGPKVPASQTERLTASIDPRAFRKSVLGQTAMPIDVRYEEWSGKDQDYCDWIVAHASHAIDGLEEIWFDTELAWSATTGVTSKFRNYFWLSNVVLEGSPANAFSFGSGKWNGSTRLTGCAYSRFRFKVTGNSKKAESPFSGGIPSRITVIGRGAKLYDPRRDSTVPGGNGPMRADDQSTWRYRADDGAVIGENLPLQILRVLLGWRIRNPVTGEMRLATGSGIPARRIDLQSFIVAANLADELVNRSAGGQEPRFHGAAVVSEGDDPKTTLDLLCAACCGRFRDTGGKLALSIAHNDLADAAIDDGLSDDDVVGAFTWDPDPALDATPNVVRGRYVDASTSSLYQLIDYPEVRIASADGMDRILTLDLGAVESASQAQRIAKQTLQRRQYLREFTAPFDIRAWKYPVGSVVPFTFAPLGFKRVLFRVAAQELGQGGTCVMTLSAEHASIYNWDRDDAAPVQAAEAIVYDGSKNPLILAINDAANTAIWEAVADPNGTKPEDNATVGAPVGTPVGGVPAEELVTRVTDVQQKVAEIDRAITDDTEGTKAARDAAEAARDAAALAQSNSEKAAADAADAKTAAQGASTLALGYAKTASDSASAAVTAKGAAETAKGAAEAAKTAAETAKGQAAASASDAQAATRAAAAAQTAAETAQSDAIAQAKAAGGSATTASQQAKNAADSASASSTSATAAASSAKNAGDSATAAAGSASTASTKATEAGQQATAAQTARTGAETAQGKAATSASNAAASETNAAGSASSAASSATVSANSAGAATATVNKAPTLPDRPANREFFGLGATNGSPDTLPALAIGTVVNAAGEGQVLEVARDRVIITPRGWLPTGVGRTFKLTARFRTTVDATGSNGCYIGFVRHSAGGGYDGTTAWALRTGIGDKVSAGWVEYTQTVTSADLGSAAYFRPIIALNSAGTANSGATMQLAVLRIEDVTSQAAAEKSATAAATSASTAATSANDAGQKASAAQTAQTAAETARSQAQTYASNASSSASDAATSAGTASMQAGVASTSANAALASAASTFPIGFGDDGSYWTGDSSFAPTPLNQNWQFVTAEGKGRVAQYTGSWYLAPKGVMPIAAGRSYRQAIELRYLSSSPSGTARVSWLVYDAAGALLGELLSSQFVMDLDAWRTIVRTISAEDLVAAYPGAAYVRPVARRFSQAPTVQVASFAFQDATAQLAAETAATAAAGSASTATTKATEAGQSASAAQTSAVNAASSATSADDRATAAANSATAAATSASTAGTKADAAGQSASAAQSSAVTAGSAATTAGDKASAAANSATAAAGSASNAATSANAAGTSASAADSAKTAAETARGQAQTYATNASNSASGAAGSASTATTQAGVATTASGTAIAAAVALLPDSTADETMFTNGGTGAPAAQATITTASYAAKVNDPVFGPAISITGGSRLISHKGVVPCIPGRKYELSIRQRVSNFVAAFTARYNVSALLGDYSAAPGSRTQIIGFPGTTSSDPQTLTTIVNCDDYPDAKWLRISFLANRLASSDTVTVIANIAIKDVTAREAAASSASAAAGSASTATSKADAAGQSASAASASATSAATSAGNASTSATNASSAASDAAGSKNSAATSAGAAAQSATAAGEKAAAAADSASSAATSASAAGTSASSASSAKTAAETAAGNAKTYQDNAATSATTATGAANTATSQAGVASTSAAAAVAGAAATLPKAFVDDGKYWTGSSSFAPTDLPASWQFVNLASKGRVAQFQGSWRISPKGFLPVIAGRTYRATMDMRYLATAEGGLVRPGWCVYDGTGALLTETTQNQFSRSADDAWVSYARSVSCDDLLASYPTAAYVRPYMRRFGGSPIVQIASYAFEDATAELSAAGSASAAATSANTASTKASEAAQSATAASTSKTAAETAQGRAEAAQSSAASSASGAAGSANAASTSASTAATHAGNAKGSADSAAASASTATSQASIASDRAAAAQSSATLSAQYGVRGGNFAVNSEWLNNSAGWVDYTTGNPNISSIGFNTQAEWFIPGQTVKSVQQTGRTSGDSVWGSWGAAIPVYEGEWFQFYMELGAHRCPVEVLVEWFGVDGDIKGVTYSDRTTSTIWGGRLPSGYAKIGVKAVKAPPGAATARLQIRKFNTFANETDSWLFLWRAYFGQAREGQTEWNAYQPGSTRDITASQIASVSQQASAIATLEGKTAAYLQNTVQAGTSAARLTMYAESSPGVRASAIELAADAIYLGNARALEVRDGQVRVNGKLSANDIDAGSLRSVNGVTTFDLTSGRVTFNNGSVMKVSGTGFGSNNQFIEWFGPVQSSLANCTEANATFYLKTDGSAYFGGSLSAGVRKNAVQTSGSRVSTGQIESGGRPRKVVVSYSYTRQAQQNSVQTAGTGSSSAVVRLLRGTTEIGRFTATGSWRRSSYGGQANPATYEESLGGSLTVTDSSGGTQVEYVAELVSTSFGPGPSGSPTQDGIGQNLSIVETEE